jgi:hypothetical protein
VYLVPEHQCTGTKLNLVTNALLALPPEVEFPLCCFIIIQYASVIAVDYEADSIIMDIRVGKVTNFFG